MATISVIIPARNEEKRIGIAVDSAFDQDRPPDEVIVVDDCSTDSTKTVAENHGATVIPGKGKGIGWAEQIGLENCTGDYVSILCGDDWWPPWTLKVQVKFMSKGWGLVHGKAALVDENDQVIKVIGRPGVPGDFAWGDYIVEDTAMARRDLMMMEGGYDTRLKRAQDMDLWIRMSKTSRFLFIPRILLYKRTTTHGSRFWDFYWRTKVLLKHGLLSQDHIEFYSRLRGRVYISAVLWAAITDRNLRWLSKRGTLARSVCPHITYPR